MPSRLSSGAARRTSRVLPSVVMLSTFALGGCQLIDGIDGKTFVEAAGGGGAPVGGQGGAGSSGTAGTNGGSADGPGGASGGAGMNGGSAGANGGSSGTNGGSAGSVTAGSAGANVGGASAGMSGAAGSAGGVTRPSWARRFGVSDLFESIREVRVTTSAIYALGVSTPSPAVNPDKGLLARFTLDGDLVWAKTYQQSDFSEFTHIEVVKDVIVVAGSTYNDGGPGSFWLLGLATADGAAVWQFLGDAAKSAGISIWGMCPLLDGTGVMLGVQKSLEWKGFQPLSATISPGAISLDGGVVFTPQGTVKTPSADRLSVFGSRYLYSGGYDNDAATLSLSETLVPLKPLDLLPLAGGLLFGDALPVAKQPGQAWLSHGTRSPTQSGPFKMYAAVLNDGASQAQWANEYSLDVGADGTHAAEVSDGFVLVAANAGSPPSSLLVKLSKTGGVTWARSLGTAFRVSSIAGVPGTGSVVLGGVTCDAGVTGCKNTGEAALVRVAADGSIDGYSKSSPADPLAQPFEPELTQSPVQSPSQVFLEGSKAANTLHVQKPTKAPKQWQATVGPIE